MIELISLISFLSVCAYIDYEHLIDNDYIESHFSRVVLRLIFLLVLNNNMIQLIGLSLVTAAVYSPMMALLLKKEWYYLGNTAYYDRFWRKIPLLYKVFVITDLIIGIYITLYA